ncbi:hypothetical protein FDECE_3466 [Fusarium decemcellulare]|nr:hypothetical protein FDECE_3466 [Fusarium decemcellulare]
MSPSDKNHFQIVYDKPSLSKGITRRDPGGTGAKATDLDLQTYPFPKSESFPPYRVIPGGKWSELRSFRNFRRPVEDTKFSLGDFVKVTNRSPYRGDRAKRMNGGSKGPRRDRVAYILEIKAADERNVFARVYWMYWPEDMPKDMPGFSDEKLESEPNELIASNHMEIINVMSVSGLETVKHMRDSRTDIMCDDNENSNHTLLADKTGGTTLPQERIMEPDRVEGFGQHQVLNWPDCRVTCGSSANFGHQRKETKASSAKIKIRDKEEVRQFLNAMFGGTTSEGEPVFDATNGILFDILPRLDQSHIISGDELDHYVSKYSHDGNARLKTPINWFRTRVQNYIDELQLLLKPIRFSMPVLFLAPTKDGALPRGTADDMDRYFENLTREEVEASHWVMWESPIQVNERVAAWLRNV